MDTSELSGHQHKVAGYSHTNGLQCLNPPAKGSPWLGKRLHCQVTWGPLASLVCGQAEGLLISYANITSQVPLKYCWPQNNSYHPPKKISEQKYLPYISHLIYYM